MGQVRCEICRTRLPTQRSLKSHYLRGHSKLNLAREIFVQTLKNTVPKVYVNTLKRKTEQRSRNIIPDPTEKTETVFARDSVQILYRNNDIIIRDDKSSVDMEFSFDENSNDARDNCPVISSDLSTKNKKSSSTLPVNLLNHKDVNNNRPISKGAQLKKLVTWQNQGTTKLILNASSSSASSEDSLKKFSFNKKIKKRRGPRDKSRHYKINITRTKNCLSLDENTGTFYQCHCKQGQLLSKEAPKIGLLKLTSDTESASDAGRVNAFNDIKVFCSKCGNGYKDEKLLIEHMKVHETHCRVCNEIFPTEQSFKEHIKAHIFKVFVCHLCNYEFPVKEMLQRHYESHVEDSVLDSVIDMEQEYSLRPCPLSSLPHQESISNILYFLTSDNDLYGSQIPKIRCDICLNEVFYSDYESHMQNVHRIYGCN
ncbi:uncharacterized protein [Euwallacea similis]|uniref:uncharacterized protein n=1 Tax=Euwallacea similis TaxID=1736056 RepID=UPI003450E11F